MGGLACGLFAPLATQAQQPAKVPRVGWLLTGSLEAPETRALLSAFRQGARERGYVEGENIVIEYRAAEGRLDRFPALAADLVRIKVDLIVAGSTSAARAAQEATTTIPIVAPTMGDPVGDGLVASLGRPRREHHGVDVPWPGAGPQAPRASQGSDPQDVPGRWHLAFGQSKRAHDKGYVEPD